MRNGNGNGKPLLVDQFGNGIKPQAYDFYRGGAISTRREMPWRYYYAAQDTHDLLPTAGWRTMMSSARFLAANFPAVRGMLMEQAMFSFPLHARYIGDDKVFGKAAEKWVHDWNQNPTRRGPPFDKRAVNRMRMLGRKIDGDIGTAYTFDEDSEFPRLQMIRSHRIGGTHALDSSGYLWDTMAKVKSGPYKGKKIYNGVVMDDGDRTIAFHIGGKTKDDEQWIPATSMSLSYRPEVSDQYRGISHLVSSIGKFTDLKQVLESEMRAHRIQSRLTMTRKTGTGIADEADERMIHGDRTATTAGAQGALTTETFDDGSILYATAGTGEGVDLLSPNRPGSDTRAFWEWIIREAFYGCEWDPDFSLALKEPGGAWARTILQKIRAAILNNVADEAREEQKDIFYGVNSAIRLGLLPKPKDGDTWSWEFQLSQPLPTSDSGNEENAIREALKMGLTTLHSVYARQGQWWQEERAQREVEIRDLLARATDIREDFPELSILDCIALIEQRSPNPNVKPADEKPMAEDK